MRSSLTDEIKKQIKEKWKEAFKLSVEFNSDRAIHEDQSLKYLHTKKNVAVYTSHDQHRFDGLYVIRGDILVESCTAEEYRKPFLSLDLEIKRVMDPLTKRNETIESWTDEDGTFLIQYFLIETGPFVSDRDFIYVLKVVETSPSESYVVLTSIDKIYTPPEHFEIDKSAVRANNIFVSQRYEQLENGDLKVSYSTLSNPCGWIPNSLTNMFLHAQPMKMLDIARLAGKNVKGHEPHVKRHQ
ncbi:hypothetical protein FDP41_011105 [Naegleria fowleri]|uniref:START domain-containing protein n=1 Tax=Naegleria fowleri TaxID=5763 RepID=A0A6A5C0Y5_NAEFO|nr:uncharacterized protein FDP41_011105 [Naegleria fowleri]KAF0983127.1 hypothetical protein FDP41_011105 [Naegleria fowleri]CAG4715352.1 unnamed protein product [Naegleria fowleri]